VHANCCKPVYDQDTISVVQISMWKHPHTEKCEDYIK
jgi:hypothetical protein